MFNNLLINYKIPACIIVILHCFQILSAQDQIIFPEKEWHYENWKPYPCTVPFVIDSMNTTGLMVIKGGSVMIAYGDLKDVTRVGSDSQLLSLLFGAHRDEITFNENLKQMGIDDIKPLREEEKQATVNDILNGLSGIYLPGFNDQDPLKPERGAYQPGTNFYKYNSWEYLIAGSIFQSKTGLDALKSFEEDIAIPLGFQDFDLLQQVKRVDSSISIHPRYRFYLSTRDMARLGYLLLRNGKWKNKQIISEDWVNLYKRKTVDFNRGKLLKGYSYMWYQFDSSVYPVLEGAFTTLGFGGQNITVIPQLDMVIAHKTNLIYDRQVTYEEYEKLIIRLIEQEVGYSTYKYEEKDYSGVFELKTDWNYLGDLELFYKNNQLMVRMIDTPKKMEFNVNFCFDGGAVFEMPGGVPIAYFNSNDSGEIVSFNLGDSKYYKKN